MLLHRLATPLLLLGLAAIPYALWFPALGFFGDDWSYIYYSHLFGPAGPGIFAVDRPFSGWFYAAVTVILGESALPYHLFLLLLRWLAAVLFWWVLRLVWPDQTRGAAIAAALMAVYPGFRQVPIAVEFILHYFVLDLFLVSLGTSLLAASEPRRWRTLGLATALGAAGVFSLEYFAGLELLRPLALWYAARRAGLRGKQLRQAVFKAWSPALGVVIAFLVWRVFVFGSSDYEPVLLADLLAHPLTGLRNLAEIVARGMLVSLPLAWRQVFDLPSSALLLPYLLVVAFSFGFAVWVLRRHGQNDGKPGWNRLWGETALAVGLAAMIAGGAPFWVTAIPITLDFPWDRPTLALMPGASLALAGLLEMLLARRYRLIAAGGLVALAAGMHYVNGAEYLREWQKLQSFTWQLVWRAPGLQPGTLLLFDVIPLNRYSDNDLTALLNWTYAPGHRSAQIPYKFFDLTLRLDSSHAGLPGLEKGLPLRHDQRGTSFRSTTSQTLALHFAPPECLKLLGPDDADWPGLSDRLQSVLAMTDLNQVVADGVSSQSERPHPPAALGAERASGWCYYFQKAELARQLADWQAVASLGDEAFSAGLQPSTPAELLPFIEGYARLGQWQRGAELAELAAAFEPARPALCRLGKRVNASMQVDATFAQTLAGAGCLP